MIPLFILLLLWLLNQIFRTAFSSEIAAPALEISPKLFFKFLIWLRVLLYQFEASIDYARRGRKFFVLMAANCFDHLVDVKFIDVKVISFRIF